MAVGHDVRRVEELLVPQPAEGALLPVGAQHTLAEAALVQPLPGMSVAIPL